MAILTSDKIDFHFQIITRNIKGFRIMIKESIQQEDITITKIHVPIHKAPKQIKQTLTDLKGKNR